MSFTYTDAQWVAFAFVILGVVLLISSLVRRYLPFLSSLFIPTAVIAGFVILLLGPQLLGAWTGTRGLIPDPVISVWAMLPGILINIVFAAVMLGKRLPSVKKIWHESAPHVILGSALSFGQFTLGCFAVVFILTPLFGLSDLAGSILELSFAGGHGTIAGMGQILADEGAPELIDLGLGLATISMVTGIIGGSLIVRYAVKNPRIPVARTSSLSAAEGHDIHDEHTAPVDMPAAASDSAGSRGMGPVTVAFMAIGLAVAIAIVMLEVVRFIFTVFGSDIFDNFPLFPFTVIGGFVVQGVASRFGVGERIEKPAVDGISAIALDVLIACAIGTMSLATLGANIPALVIFTLIAVSWSVFGMLWLGPRIHPVNWFEHSLADFGQSQGNVATGFVLADMADPRRQTSAANAYGYKQLTYEPFLGGGILTAFSVPLIAQVGSLVFGVVAALVTVLLVFWGFSRARR